MDTNGNAAASGRSIGPLLAETARRLGSAPLLTYYDDRGGERTELSYATFDNWVAKAANLLAEAVDAQPGQRLRLDVLDHWLGAVVMTAAWRAGLVVALGAPEDAEIVVTHESSAAQGGGAPDARTIFIGDGFGGRVTADVSGVAFGDEVLAYADFYDGPEVPPDAAALTTTGREWSHGDLVTAAAGLGSASSRVLSTSALRDVTAVAATLVAPLLVGGSVVWCPRGGGSLWRERAVSERATHVVTDGRWEPLDD